MKIKSKITQTRKLLALVALNPCTSYFFFFFFLKNFFYTIVDGKSTFKSHSIPSILAHLNGTRSICSKYTPIDGTAHVVADIFANPQNPFNYSNYFSFQINFN